MSSTTLDFSGQKVVVTGVTSGMGYAVARHVLDAGGSAVVTGRTQSSADEAAVALSTHGNAVGLAADLADPRPSTACASSSPRSTPTPPSSPMRPVSSPRSPSWSTRPRTTTATRPSTGPSSSSPRPSPAT
ncbi:SDR family NAD(P)-dependent oxidoreductase [Streptomyces sp. NPDC059679]|uniref:SDR family NAD(P)-dependent oxidoreductase n=1 Tax=Streptomyces sp. NPDC059679 TaxID=3346903 RepID=UPI0036D10736